jgi:hypothetical protein
MTIVNRIPHFAELEVSDFASKRDDALIISSFLFAIAYWLFAISYFPFAIGKNALSFCLHRFD